MIKAFKPCVYLLGRVHQYNSLKNVRMTYIYLKQTEGLTIKTTTEIKSSHQHIIIIEFTNGDKIEFQSQGDYYNNSKIIIN